MPGTNLTRDEAATRAALLARHSHDRPRPHDDDTDTFASDHHPIRFTCSEPGAETFADLVDATVHEITLNGRDARPVRGVRGTPDRAGRPRRRQRAAWSSADCPTATPARACTGSSTPSTTASTSTRSSRCPTPAASTRRFEQPDLKALFTFTSPRRRHWKVVSNSPTPEPEAAGDGAAVWRFAPTERMSTYITALVAGEYHDVLRQLRRQARHHPARPLLPPVARRAPRRRRARQDHQAGLRVLRGRPSTTPTRSASTTSSTCRSTTWARWRTPAA